MTAAVFAEWLQPINLAYAMIVMAMFLALFRLVRGPSLPDRVVALDLITVLAAAMLGLDTLATRQAVFIDAAIVLALISFLGTIAFARYLERRARSE